MSKIKRAETVAVSALAQHDGLEELQNMSAKVAKLQESRVERPKLPRNLKEAVFVSKSVFHGTATNSDKTL